MTQQVLAIQNFYGGQSSNSSMGPKASFAYGRALEFRRDPGQLSVLPGPRKISGSTVTDLPLNMVQVLSGDRYSFGSTGGFYKIATDNTVTEIANSLTSGSDGLLYRTDSDAIYMATSKTLERYAPISGTPTFDYSYGPSKSIDTNAYRTGGTLTYTLPISISETATNYFSFQPDIEPFYSIKVKVVAKGTGDWTLTLHDGLDTVLATKTIANASLTNGVLNEFIFASQVRAYVKPNARTYHVHLTSTVADGTVQVATVSDLSTADFELWADRLVDTTNGLHPIAQFLQYTLIGNGNYLAVWEPLSPDEPSNNEFQRHRLTFPDGFEVCGVAPTDEFSVIAIEKRSTDGTKDFQEGKLIIWDGTAQTYNQIIDVSGGSPESIRTYNNYPYFYVNGSLCAWFGGKNIVQIRALANTDTTYKDTIDNTHCYPNMMTIRDNLLHLGYPSTTTNQSIEHGVYTWGTLDKDYPNSFGYGYVISTQTRLNTLGTLEIGFVKNFGDEMYIGWKDGTDYGIDIVDSYCDPAPTFAFRSLEFDAGITRKTKLALRTGIDTEAVPSNVTITPIHQKDDASDVTHDSIAIGAVETISTIQDGRFKNITIGFDGVCSGITTPVIKSIALLWDSLEGEKVL